MRIGEALALNWNDLDFKENSICSEKNLAQTNDAYAISTTKTEK